MAYYPYAPSLSDVYWLVSPTGAVTARFNGDTTDPNWCGSVTDLAGLESPEVRESAEDLSEADGGMHGNFWFARRPIVMTVQVYNHATVAARNMKIDRIARASTAMRGDAELHWIPDSAGALPGQEMMTWVRRQQPLKVSGDWIKDVQIPLVSQYARIYSASLNLLTAGFNVPITVENQGSYASLPTINITGPITGPIVNNTTNGKLVGLMNAVVPGHYVSIDTLFHTATEYVVGTNAYVADRTADLDFLSSTWPTVDMGNNTFVMGVGTGTTGATQLQVLWRDTWV